MVVTARAEGPVDPAHIEATHPTADVHDHADQTWPPQPRGLRKVVPLSNPGNAERAADLRRQARAGRERLALARPEVRWASATAGRKFRSPEPRMPGARNRRA